MQNSSFSLVLIAVAAAAATAQSLPTSELARIPREVRSAAVSPDATHVYYTTGISVTDTVWVFDVAARKSSVLMVGQAFDLDVSPKGDRLAFRRPGADGGATNDDVWTVPLDARTGLTAGTPRRTTVTNAVLPKFSIDGESILFRSSTKGQARRLNVVPTRGGPERTLVAVHDAYQPLGWSADGKWIYYGLDASGSAAGGIFRVAQGGGKPERLSSFSGWAQGAGFSPNHQLIASFVGDTTRILGLDGKTVGRVPGWIDHWFGPTKMLTVSNEHGGLESIGVGDNQPRTLLPAALNITAVRWSPDGSGYAAASDSGRRPRLHLSVGGSERSIALPEAVEEIVWSPDGRYIATLGRRIHIVEIASGALSQPPAAAGRIADFRWTADSRRLRYLLVTSVRPDETGNYELRETSAGGRDAIIRQLGRWASAALVSPDHAVIQDSVVRLHSIADGATRRLGTGFPAGASADGRLIALRSTTNLTRIVDRDGRQVASISYPFAVGPGVNRRFLPSADGSAVFAVGNRGPGECCALYQGFGNGSQTRQLTAFARPSTRAAFDLSPDGKTILFVSGGRPETILRVIDISPILPRR